MHCSCYNSAMYCVEALRDYTLLILKSDFLSGAEGSLSAFLIVNDEAIFKTVNANGNLKLNFL